MLLHSTPFMLILLLNTIAIHPAQNPHILKWDSTFCHFSLIFSFTYDKAICVGQVKSISVRIESTKDAHMQSIVKECGSKLTKDFVDISYLFRIVWPAEPFHARSMVDIRLRMNYELLEVRCIAALPSVGVERLIPCSREWRACFKRHEGRWQVRVGI